MRIKHKGLRALVALAGTAAAMFVTQLATPTAAHAYCAGEGNPRALELRIDGELWAREVATTNTCNDNTTYQGDFYSWRQGWQAVVLKQDDGQWTRFYGASNWLTVTHYQFEDDNSRTLIILCVTDGNNWKCGNRTSSANSTGGPNYTFFEVNEGF